MKNFSRKSLYVLLVLIFAFLAFPVHAMKSVGTHGDVPICKEMLVLRPQNIAHHNSLPEIPRQITSKISKNIGRYGIQRNRLLKKCFSNIVNIIKSIFQREYEITVIDI